MSDEALVMSEARAVAKMQVLGERPRPMKSLEKTADGCV
jgi:hypothetical protein